jgi:hypothetical protein
MEFPCMVEKKGNGTAETSDAATKAASKKQGFCSFGDQGCLPM